MRSGTDPEQVEITLDPHSEEMIGECCSGTPGRMILRLIVSENTVQGEPVKGSITLHESRKIYDKGYTLAEVGDIPAGLGQEEAEMRRTFNLGLGMLLVVPPEGEAACAAACEAAGERAFAVGEVVASDGPAHVQFA